MFTTNSAVGTNNKLDFSNHTVICNWNDKVPMLMDDLHSNDNKRKRASIIITDNITTFPEPDKKYGVDPFQDTAIIPGKPCDTRTLVRAGADDAHTIIILPDFRHQDPDNYSLQIALTVKDFIESKKENNLNKDHNYKIPRILVNVVDSNNATHFDNFSITGINEVVCENELGLRAPALSSINHNSASVFNEIMTYSESSSELYSIVIPRNWYEEKSEEEIAITSFQQICEKAYSINNNTEVVVVGYIRINENGKANAYINPPISRLRENNINQYKHDDRLLVLAKNIDVAERLFYPGVPEENS